MKNTVPHTPFSTPLSGSARVTELRLKNIFSGPKKRPPVLFLALMFSICVFCGNLVSCQVAEAQTDASEPAGPLPAEVWLDYFHSPEDMPWDDSAEIQLPEYPGVTFRWTSGSVSTVGDGEPYLLFSGMPVWSVFLCDLNGDGMRELCATVSYGSGVIDEHIMVFDYASDKICALWDRMEYDYVLSLEDGQLLVTKSEYMGPVVSKGPLVLTEGGQLKMEGETPDVSAPVQTGPLPLNEPVKLEFSSGVGAWQTELTLRPDGSFEGYYSDADMDAEYVCQFHGRFTDITQLTDASWSLTLEELVLDTFHPIGEEWDGTQYYYAGRPDGWVQESVHYVSSAPYGFTYFDGTEQQPLEPGARFVFYTPDASASGPDDELYGMEDESSELYHFWTWWPRRHQITGTGETLGCCALRNVTSGYGFFDLHAWGIE